MTAQIPTQPSTSQPTGGPEALPARWDDFAAGQAETRIIVKPNEAAPS